MDNNFDKEIKKALDNLREEEMPMDWGRMEKLIEEDANLKPELEDLYLDGIVYDSLHNLDVSYEPAHWALMKEKLADPYALRRRLMKYKVAEVALVLLFIFTLVQFLPFKKFQHQDIASISAGQKDGTSDQEEIIKTAEVLSPVSKFQKNNPDDQQAVKAISKQNMPDLSLTSSLNEARAKNNDVNVNVISEIHLTDGSLQYIRRKYSFDRRRFR